MMPLDAGTALGPYAILAPIGAGGMGQVYRAVDTRLGRTVALKVLADAVSANAEFRTRFEREARAIAALNHPHICTIHDVGRHDDTDFLVMELVEGQTLSARLEQGPLPLEQAIRHGAEMADALDKAHRAGIVHRDLKPDNVMLTKAGVKLLDFGLAKSYVPAMSSGGVSVLPTVAASLTLQGTILGTLQYMAPEQIEGGEADARTDIFAFGAVLYEMVTGRKAFTGRSAASLMGAILRDEPPPLTSLQPLAPAGLERVVKTCLAKEPDDRWQSARDLLRELQWLGAGPAGNATRLSPTGGGRQSGPSGVRTWTRARAWVLAAAGLLAGTAIGAAAVAWWSTAPPPGEAPVTRWSFPTQQLDNASDLQISRDGRLVLFAGSRADGVRRLHVRFFGQIELLTIRGTDGALDAALSPDARWVVFSDTGQVRRVSIDGGAPLLVCDAPGGAVGLVWAPDDTIVFGTQDGLRRVAATGGTPEVLTRTNPARETAHGWPDVLPDGETIVFAIGRGISPTLALVPLGGGTPRLLVEGTSPRASADGRLLFVRGTTVWAARLDAQAARFVNEPTPVLDGVTSLLSGYGAFDVSRTATLVYRPRLGERHQLSWVEAGGRTSRAVDEALEGSYHGPPSISPDGTKLAVTRHAIGGQDEVGIYDLLRGGRTPIGGMSGSTSRWPVWTPDGRTLTFASERDGSWDIFEVPAGGGEPRVLLAAPDTQTPLDWSPDGTVLAYQTTRGVPKVEFLARGGAARPPAEPFPGGEASFSPDGKWVLYQRLEAGRTDVFLHPFPGPGTPVQISTSGGRTPVWSHDGRSIYFVTPDYVIMRVALQFTPEPMPGAPVEFARIRMTNDASPPYAVASDGRLLVIQDLNDTPPSIVVVENWGQELARRREGD